MKNTLLRLCAAGIVLLGSLVPATAADSKLIVAMLPKSKGNAYFISVKAGADKAAKELGISKRLLLEGMHCFPQQLQAIIDRNHHRDRRRQAHCPLTMRVSRRHRPAQTSHREGLPHCCCCHR